MFLWRASTFWHRKLFRWRYARFVGKSNETDAVEEVETYLRGSQAGTAGKEAASGETILQKITTTSYIPRKKKFPSDETALRLRVLPVCVRERGRLLRGRSWSSPEPDTAHTLHTSQLTSFFHRAVHTTCPVHWHTHTHTDTQTHIHTRWQADRRGLAEDFCAASASTLTAPPTGLDMFLNKVVRARVCVRACVLVCVRVWLPHYVLFQHKHRPHPDQWTSWGLKLNPIG